MSELVEFKTSDNLYLPGLLFEPAQKTDRAALFLHGNGSASIFYNVNGVNSMAQELARRGIAYFPFNNRGAHYIHKLWTEKDGTRTREPYGAAYELIKECLFDIDGALEFLKQRGYREFYLLGSSTGANKICVYNFYKPKNKIAKYVLFSGGDDTGISYQMMGEKNFYGALEKCRYEIKKGHGRKLLPKSLTDYLYSYQSFYDTINPDGDYNVFPFNEYMNHLKLSKKPLFREYKSIKKPTLVVYGGDDEYCYGKVPEIIGILKKECSSKKQFTFEIIEKADHNFNGREADLAKVIAHWLSPYAN